MRRISLIAIVTLALATLGATALRFKLMRTPERITQVAIVPEPKAEDSAPMASARKLLPSVSHPSPAPPPPTVKLKVKVPLSLADIEHEPQYPKVLEDIKQNNMWGYYFELTNYHIAFMSRMDACVNGRLGERLEPTVIALKWNMVDKVATGTAATSESEYLDEHQKAIVEECARREHVGHTFSYTVNNATVPEMTSGVRFAQPLHESPIYEYLKTGSRETVAERVSRIEAEGVK